MRNFRLDDESGHQEALFEWAAYHMDCMPELEYMHHIPNGGKRDKRTAVVGRGSDERILLHEIHAALELYTDKVADNSLEKEIEENVLFDVEYTKYQETIESEDMVQTAYEFTIYEKVRKKG